MAGSGGNDNRVQPLPTSPPQAAAPVVAQQQVPAQPAAPQPTPAAGVTVSGGCFAAAPVYGSDDELVIAKQRLDFAAIMFGGLLAGVVGLVAFRRRFHKA